MSARREGAGARTARTTRRVVQVLLSLTLAALLLVVVLPRITGTEWTDVADQLLELSPQVFLGLFVVWQLGLWAYSFVLAASMPGMTKPQGYVMNFVSSAVANLVPFGGAAGVGVMWWMARGWGFDNAAFGLFTLITFVANILAKTAVPAVALGVLVVSGGRVAKPAVETAAFGAALCALVVAASVAMLVSGRLASAVARGTDAVARRVQRLLRIRHELDWAAIVLRMRDRSASLLREQWHGLVGGMVAYQALQALLMWLCLAAVGGPTGWAEVLCAFASGRLLTSVVLTPGGTGFAETGAAAVLVALGGEPSSSVAGVLLFSVFTYVLEIPFGALCLVVHLLMRRWHRPVGEPADAPTSGQPAG